MWISVEELRECDIKVRASDLHNNEWLCCGPVPNSCINRVMPFDGETLHQAKFSKLVESLESTEKYIFNWNKKMWLHDPDMSDPTDYRKKSVGDKRKRKDIDSLAVIMALVETEFKRIQSRHSAADNVA
jgi:hypothetical protein